MLDFDLIALDLDGTLLNARDEISPRNRSAIRAALDAGVRVVLVTGRGQETPSRLAHELGLNLPVICAHGALTKDFLSGKIYGHVPLPLPYAKELVTFAQARELAVAVYAGERFYSLTQHAQYMETMHGPGWIPVENLVTILRETPTLVRFLGRPSVEAMRGDLGNLPVHYKYETWGDFEECAITSKDATKERALAQLCADFTIESTRVMAIGDSRNDIPMLQWAGLGIAMANANPEVRDAIPVATASADEDGVALAIEHYILKNIEKTA